MVSSARSSSTVWEGHAELKRALDALATAKGTSANRVKAVAIAAFKYAKDYKRVVHDVEMFLWKAEVEHRLAGLYAMDAIMRHSQSKMGAKDPFIKRFLLHMNNTIAAIRKVPAEHQEQARHVVEEWQTRGYYTPAQIEEAGGHSFSVNSSHTGHGSSTSIPQSSSNHADSASKEKLASLLSLIKKQKELKEQEYTRQQASPRGESKPTNAPALLPRPSVPPLSSRQSLGDRKSYSDRDRPIKEEYEHGRRSPTSSVSRRAPDRREFADTRDSWNENTRETKKPRGSRWGPPRSATGTEPIKRAEPRPEHVDSARMSEPERFPRQSGSFISTQNRYDGPPDSSDLRDSRAALPSSYPRAESTSRSLDRRLSPRRDRDADYDAKNPSASSAPPSSSRGSRERGQSRSPMTRSYNYQASTGSDAGRNVGDGHEPSWKINGSTLYDAHGSRAAPPPTRAGGDKPAGGSGEVCRKFVSGRCTFGDRCWHVHDQQALSSSTSSRPRMEVNNQRRKTVLCSNFPSGNCRFGDRCSFAHGEEDLDESSRAKRWPKAEPYRGGPSMATDTHSGAASDSRWQQQGQQKPSNTGLMSSAGNSYDRSSYAQPPQSRPPPYGLGLNASSHPPVYNGPRDGSVMGGTHNTPHQNGEQSTIGYDHAAQGYNDSGARSHNPNTPGGTGRSGFSTASQPELSLGSRSNEPRGSGGLTSATALASGAGTHGSVNETQQHIKEDEEVETAAPEFTLQYDDED